MQEYSPSKFARHYLAVPNTMQQRSQAVLCDAAGVDMTSTVQERPEDIVEGRQLALQMVS